MLQTPIAAYAGRVSRIFATDHVSMRKPSCIRKKSQLTMQEMMKPVATIAKKRRPKKPDFVPSVEAVTLFFYPHDHADAMDIVYSNIGCSEFESRIFDQPPNRSRHGLRADSKITLPDIFDCPARRSVNVIGISTIRSPSRWARKAVST